MVIALAVSLIGIGLPAITSAATPVFRPIADAEVVSSSPDQNFGAATTLHVSQAKAIYRTYLQFDVSGLSTPVTSVVLRLYVTNVSSSRPTIALTPSSWTESGVTWRNAPAASGSTLGTMSVSSTGWSDTVLPAATIATNGRYAFVVQLASSDAAIFQSREATNPAQLVLTTAPASPTPTPTPTPTSTVPGSDPTLVAAGDIACQAGSAETASNCRQTETGRLLAGADAVLTLGDNQYEAGSLTDFTASFDKSWGTARSRMHPVPGNHEYGTPSARGYRDYFGYSSAQPLYYSWEVGAWHVIALDSETGTATGSAQERWLQADLAAHPRACTLAYWHKPLFSSGEHGPNAIARPLWADLYAAGADVVLNGHDHDYERFAPQDAAGTSDPALGIREFVVGTGGKSHYPFVTIQANSQVRNETTFGVLKLTLHATSFDWHFVPEAGAAFTDSGSSACNAPTGGSNTAPTADPVSVTTTLGLSTTWLPSAHDPDPGTTLACSIASQPAHGVASVASDCSTGTYAPNPGFVGSDPFTYRASDGALSSPAATVSVVVGSGAGSGSILLVQQVGASGSAASLPIAVPATGSGHALVIAIALAAGSSASVLGVTDSAGGPWTKASVGYLTGINSRVEIWHRLGAPPVTSVTVTLSSAKAVAASVTEWSGVSRSVDVALGAGQASATGVTTPVLSTRTAPDLVVGAVNYPATASSTLAASAFTELSPFNASSAVHGRAAWLVTSTVGSLRASWTLSGPSGGSGGAIVGFVGGP